MSLGLRLFMAIEVTLCYVPGLFLRFMPFWNYTSKKQKKKLCIIYPILLLANMVIMFFGISDFEGSTPLVRIDMLLIQILLVGTNMIVMNKYKKIHIFIFGFVAACMYMLLSFATYFSKFFFTENPLSQYLFGTGLYILLMLIGYMPVYSMLKKTILPLLLHSSTDCLQYVWYIPLILYVSMFVALPINENIESLSLLFNRAFISISILIFARGVAANHQMILEKQALEEQLNHSGLHYAGMQTEIETARRIRHDLKHILNAARHYIEIDDKSGLSAFCDMVEETQLENVEIPYTGSPAADGVLYHYIKRAKESDILFRYHGKLGNSGISDMELCILIGNALENAFEGCMTISKNRFVTLTAQKEENLLSVMIRNSFDGKIDVKKERIFSRKEEDRIGVGLETMRILCEKNKGSLKTEWKDHIFTILMVLDAESET